MEEDGDRRGRKPSIDLGLSVRGFLPWRMGVLSGSSESEAMSWVTTLVGAGCDGRGVGFGKAGLDTMDGPQWMILAVGVITAMDFSTWTPAAAIGRDPFDSGSLSFQNFCR